jgi:magnesium-transporting ATPase (P-type)
MTFYASLPVRNSIDSHLFRLVVLDNESRRSPCFKRLLRLIGILQSLDKKNSKMSANHEENGDFSIADEGLQEARRHVTLASRTEEVLDKHLPKPVHPSSPSVDHITKINQDAIRQYDDLKLAHHVTEFGTGTEAQFRERLQQEQERQSKEEPFVNVNGLTTSEANARLQQYGRNELPERKESRLSIFCRLLFCAPMPIMIWIAMFILIAIGNVWDAAILCFIQFTNAFISFYEVTKAGNAVAALKSSLRPTATSKRDGAWTVMDAALLVPGDTILLASGSHVPADCRLQGTSSLEVDQSALTGESLPVTFYPGDSCKMGSTVVRGEAEVRQNGKSLK